MLAMTYMRRIIACRLSAPAALLLLTTLPSAAQTPSAVDRNSIVILHSNEPRSFNPIVDIVKTSLTITNNVIEPLVGIGEKFEPVPALATSWQQVDPTTWEFTLRKGVQFHNGEPFDAAAAAAAIIAARDTPGVLQGFFKPVIKDATAKSPDVLVVTTTVPSGVVPAMMTFQYVLPPKYFATDPKRFGTAPIGTGPFAFEKWESGKSVRLVRNDDYWGTKPKLDSLVFRFVPDPQTQISLLTSGDADFVESFPPELLPNVAGRSGVHVVRVDDLRKAFLEVNTHVKPFSDPQVREALASAIDREAIVKAIFRGDAHATTAILNSNFPSATEFPAVYKYDPQKSKAILKKVGDIVPVELYGPVGRYPNDKLVGEAIAGMLTKAGFQVTTHFMETGAFFTLLGSQNMPGAHFLTLAPLYPHEDFVMRTQFTTDGLYRYCGTKDLDVKIDAAMGLADDSERTETYKQIATFIATENRCWVPIYDFVQLYGVADRVQGLKLYPHGFISYLDVTVNK
jgi:peptide/nickel transport system substrate-binding protein